MQDYKKWVTNKGRTVVNERCQCGELRTKHADNHPVFAQGHGPCKASGCARYTFFKFVYERQRKAA